MLTPYKYLAGMKGKNSKIISQPWMMNLTQSTLLNVMKIPYFGRHQEVNIAFMLPWQLLMDRPLYHSQSDIDL
jgi:hypothetical protein